MNESKPLEEASLITPREVKIEDSVGLRDKVQWTT